MVKELTNEELESLNDLETNMHSRLNDFRKEMLGSTKETQHKELISLMNYVDGCRRSEIDDTLVNIRYCEGKIVVLESIISKDEIL